MLERLALVEPIRPPNIVLLLDGIFLRRPELDDCSARYHRRYVPGRRLYLSNGLFGDWPPPPAPRTIA